MNSLRLLILLGIFHFHLGNGQLCTIQNTCESCLRASLNCTWCTDIRYQSAYRCMTKDALLRENCPPAMIIENRQTFEVIKNENMQDYQGNGLRAIQIQPQKIRMTLIKSKTQRFKITYRPAKNDPLDLYFLMDLTWSMRDDKETLIKISSELVGTLKSLTPYYRLGYGSFADKPSMPMMMPGYEDNPCRIEKSECEPTYGFHHHLSFTNNVEDFVQKVKKSRVTGNLDNLEGQLDALMQVIVCSEEIGWSDEARKVVLLATDGLIHFAGDGKLAGIVERNDKKCHLNRISDYMEYNGTLKYDYPSLEEIYRELLKRKVNVIFAVPQTIHSYYSSMSDLMKEISSVEIVTSNSSNLLEVIKKGYQRFVSRAQFVSNNPSHIDMTFETDCGGFYKKLRGTNICDQVEGGKPIDIYVNITLTDFPTDGIFNHKIKVEGIGISEFLEIDVELQKPCPCNDPPDDTEDGRYYCNNHGYFKCGMCRCDEGWLGSRCTCDSGNYTSMKFSENLCRPDTSSGICSNRGDCECGFCHCIPGFNGKYCECPDCVGSCRDPETMECQCGECVCKEGAIMRCISPKGDICSSHGVCECGTCRCDTNHFGKFCEFSPGGENKLCDFYEGCIQCLTIQLQKRQSCESKRIFCLSNENCDIEQNYRNYEDCVKNIQNACENICQDGDGNRMDFDFVDNLEEYNCTIRVINEESVLCEHYYSYHQDNFGISSLKIKYNSCKPFNATMFGAIIFIITIFLGLGVIIVMKVIFYVKDKREFVKFEKEVIASARYETNPIFKPATTSYIVPKEEEDTF